jgi:hypothetical protein
MVSDLPRLRSRRGKTRWGCLLTLVLLGVGIYYGIGIVQSYLRYYQLKDEMTVQARYAVNIDDDAIRRRLRAKADELALPAEAKRFSIRRRSRPREIIITTSWQDTLSLPFYHLLWTYRPEVREKL